MNIPRLLAELRIPYESEGHRHVTAGWVGIDCPMCGPRSGKFKMGINVAGGFCNCWTCGGARLGDVLAAASGEDLRTVLALMKGMGWTPRGKGEEKRRALEVKVPPKIGDFYPAHRRYLLRRGFDPEEVGRLWGVRGIPAAPNLAWRLWIPILHQGELVSWTTRAIGERINPRYVSASADEETVNHRHLLYGADYARHAVVICEGPTDVWAIGPGAVATLGVGFTREQIVALERYSHRVILFDQEPNAQRRAYDLWNKLEGAAGVTENVLLDSADDPAAASEDEVADIRKTFLM